MNSDEIAATTAAFSLGPIDLRSLQRNWFSFEVWQAQTPLLQRRAVCKLQDKMQLKSAAYLMLG